MQAMPNPTLLTKTFSGESDAEGHRNTFCLSYSRCLDESIRRRWENWTCSKCQFAQQTARIDVVAHAQSRRGNPFGA
jgi:hypothetical protein